MEKLILFSPLGTCCLTSKLNALSFKGSYIFAEASAPAATGNTARLLSKLFPETSGRCMRFWYSMYGAGMGVLNVYLKDPANGAMEKIWSKSGDQGKNWKNGEVTIKRAANYKVDLVF